MSTASTAVRELLIRSGLSKSELCARAGMSRSLLDDYLKDHRQPGVAQLERLGEAAGLRLDVIWNPPPAEVDRTPTWARPNPAMDPTPTTVEERAQILLRVVEVAMELRRRPRGELEFPPLRTLRERAPHR